MLLIFTDKSVVPFPLSSPESVSQSKELYIILTGFDSHLQKSDEPPNMSPKRKQGEQGDVLYPYDRESTRRKVTVLEIGDLEREYLLVLARLQLIKIDADPTRATGLNLGTYLASMWFESYYIPWDHVV